MTAPIPRTLAAAMLLVGVARAQTPDPQTYRNADDFSSEALYATFEVEAGARATGLGGNFVAVADDASALAFNPAGLAQLVRLETSLGLATQKVESTHGMFGVEAAADASYSNIDHVALAYPFPTYRGSFVVGGGVFRSRSNELDTARRDRRTGATNYHDDFDRSQGGGLWRWTAGLGVDVVRDVSFGFSMSYWEGDLRDDQLRTIDESGTLNFQYQDRLVTESDVDGFNFDLGLLAIAGRNARIGVTIRSPVWLEIEGVGEYVHTDASGSSREAVFISDEPRLPWTMAAGLSYGLGGILLTGEARYTAWDEIDGVPQSLGSVPGADPDYDSKWGGGAGVEVVLPRVPLRVRGGWSLDPEAYRLHLGNPAVEVGRTERWSVGGGLLLANSFALDAAFVYSEFERADAAFSGVFERREDRRVHVTGAYRF
jgi:hypothetical protein